MRLKIYRIVSTGMFAYVATDGTREVFRADCSCIPMWPQVQISVREGQFHFLSEIDPEITLVPGSTCRTIRNRKTDSVAATLRFEDDGFYSIFCPGGWYTIEDRQGEYLAFVNNERLCLTMKRDTTREPVPEALRQEWQYYDVEPWLTVHVMPGVPEPTAVLLACFPLLRFDRHP